MQRKLTIGTKKNMLAGRAEVFARFFFHVGPSSFYFY
jgi:hypothetical protein